MKKFFQNNIIFIIGLFFVILMLVFHKTILFIFPNTVFGELTFYTELTLIVIALLFSVYSFDKSYKLTKDLSNSAIELIEVKHILKEDKSGYESFAIFKNNSTQEITLKHKTDKMTKKPYPILLKGFKNKTISTIFGKYKRTIPPGGFTSIKVADMSFRFVESQEFYNLNNEQEYLSLANRGEGINVVFSYTHLNKEWIITVPIYPYDYNDDKIKQDYSIEDEKEIKAVYLFLKDTSTFVFEDSLYYRLTEKSIEVCSMDNHSEIESWIKKTEQKKINFDFDLEWDAEFLQKIQKFFFSQELTKDDHKLFEKINVAVIEYPDITIIKSYTNNNFGERIYGYSDNSIEKTSWTKIKHKMMVMEKNLVKSVVIKTKKEKDNMKNHQMNNKVNFFELFLKFIIISMIPLSIIGLISIGIIGTLIVVL